MELIVIDNQRGETRRLSKRLLVAGLAAPAVLIALIATGTGYLLGNLNADAEVAALLPEDVTAQWMQEIEQNRQDIADARSKLTDDTQALARKLAAMQANMLRVNAAGQRLVEVAQLDEGEFAFDIEPAVGGPINASDAEGELPNIAELDAELTALGQQLDDRENQMQVLTDLLMASKLQDEVKPSGRPITSGWLSSLFGTRTDPFTGRKAQHYGLDFAGREGADVVSVASGVVTWAGKRYGYGQLVEVNHGNGYVTRYGHNKTNLVAVGDRVTKGDVIALMGNSGRSTGPHVHFEVLKDGRVVNPAKYIKAAN